MAGADEQTRNFSGAGTTRPRLSLLIYHRDGARIVPLDDANKIVVIGRAAPSQIQIDDDSLSRQHARVTLLLGEAWIEDLESTNGTLLNGARVTKARLQPGDQVTMGGVTLSLYVPVRSEQEETLGLESHDALVKNLEHEVLRAKAFARSLALVMVRGESHLTRWLARARSLLRPVDRVAAYSPDTLEVLLPELSAEEAVRVARAISAAADPPLRCGVAYFPSAAASAAELLEAARSATGRATGRQPVQFVGGFATAEHAHWEPPVVESPAMKHVYQTVRRVARAPLPVLIFGETGTGKELVARAIHHGSARAAGPMRCINSAAIPSQLIESVLFGHERGAFTGAERRQKGVFEEADGGTVFLDEVGELSPAAQAALLRVLETKQLTRVGSHELVEVDVRVVAATHCDLEAMCAAGTFRQDLFYRLNAVTIAVPPLRDRVEEISPLAEHFLAQSAFREGPPLRISAEALSYLESYRWPGNVRELRNAIERAAVISAGETVDVEDLPENVREGGTPVPRDGEPEAPEGAFDLRGEIRALEIRLIRRALNETAWNQTEAAALLGIPRRTLVRRLGEYGIRKPAR